LKGPPTYSKQEIRRAVIVYAKLYRLDPALLRAVIKVESNFRQDAISRRGAVGLMQLMPPTAARLQVANIHDPLQNNQGGAKHLAANEFLRWKSARHLAAYNAGVHREATKNEIREKKAHIQTCLRTIHPHDRHDVSSSKIRKVTEGQQQIQTGKL
jgi:soluble lytic murein transglycosylase